MMAETTKGRKPKEQKRGHGEGSIYQRKDGTWAGVSRYEDPETGEKKKHFVYGKTRSDVAKKKKDWEDELKKGILPSKGKITVSEWLDTWLETYKKNSVRANTYEDYQRIVEGHLKPEIGKIMLKDLRAEQIQKMLNKKYESGNLNNSNALSPRRIECIYVTIHSALDQAVKNQLIIRNVCDSVTKPKKIKHEFIPWTTEQTNKFLSSVKDSRLFPIYLTEWGTGLRRSELLGLQWPDIDFKKGTLTVKRSLTRSKGGCKFGEPKTPKSRRIIPLPDQLLKELKSWKAKQAMEKMNWNNLYANIEPEKRPVFNPLNMVFCDEAGRPMNPDFVSRSFKVDLEKAKLPEIRFHDLRHGHATMLLELGEDIKVISERLGHSSITMTADTYSHVREKMQKEASIKLEQVLNLN